MARSTSKGSGRAAGSAAAGSGTAGAHEHESAQTYRGHSYDIGTDEAQMAGVHSDTRAWNANVKRTYDEHQTYDHDSRTRARSVWEDSWQARARQAEDLHNLKLQAMQNAVETANMLSKQAVAHRDIAIDREWNIDEVAQLVAKNPVFLDAIAAAVAQAVQGGKKS